MGEGGVKEQERDSQKAREKQNKQNRKEATPWAGEEGTEGPYPRRRT